MSSIQVVLLCLLLAACGSRPPRGLWTDPTLDANSLGEGIAIGGVVDLTDERDVYAMQQDAKLLESALRENRPSLDVAPWAEARSLVEPDTLDAILASFRLSGRLTGHHLEALAPVATQSRYLMFARIDLDHTVWEYTRRIREMSDRTVVDLDPESRRTISLLLDVYDLQTRSLVYTIPVSRTGVEHGSLHTVESIESVPTETEIRNAIEDLQSSNARPDPADRERLLAAMFKEATKYLP
jgi:hypothetical protein